MARLLDDHPKYGIADTMWAFKCSCQWGSVHNFPYPEWSTHKAKIFEPDYVRHKKTQSLPPPVVLPTIELKEMPGSTQE